MMIMKIFFRKSVDCFRIFFFSGITERIKLLLQFRRLEDQRQQNYFA